MDINNVLVTSWVMVVFELVVILGVMGGIFYLIYKNQKLKKQIKSLEDQTGIAAIKQIYSSGSDLVAYVAELLDGVLPKMGSIEEMSASLLPQDRKRISSALSIEQTYGITAMVNQEFEGVLKMREIAIRTVIATRAESLQTVIIDALMKAYSAALQEMMNHAEGFAPMFAHSPLFFEEHCHMVAAMLARNRRAYNPDNLPIPPELVQLARQTFEPLRAQAAQLASGQKVMPLANLQHEPPVELEDTRKNEVISVTSEPYPKAIQKRY